MSATQQSVKSVQGVQGIRDGSQLLVRRPFSVDDYHRMAETGLLGEDERTELLDGEVVVLMPISSRHAGCVNALCRWFVARLLDRAVVAAQNPVRLSPHSEPEPDLCLLAPREDFYRSAHPEPADVFLLVEVADSSIEPDRRVKAPLYAAAGIREFWLVDLNQDRVEVYRQPGAEGYGQLHTFGRGERITPLAFPEVEIAVAEILGPD